jgi:pimeloyl-ACP methyl ester carboxylesterase
MTPKDYKYVEIDGVSIAYTERGSGQPILFIHDFASYSYTWMKVIDLLPLKFRFIAIDLKGHGYSEKRCDDNLALFDHAVIIKKFIKLMNLNDFVLVGHSMGGVISLLALFDKEISKKTAKLVLLDSAGVLAKLYDFLGLISASSRRTKFKLAREDMLALSLQELIFYDKSKITYNAVTAYGNIFRQKNAIECLIETAKQCALADIHSFHKNVRRITVPTLIIWGEKDAVLGIEYSSLFKSELSNSEFELIADCGHSPQEEKPLETANIIADFLGVFPKLKKVSSSLEKSNKQVDHNIMPDTNLENRVFSTIDQIKQMSFGYIRNIKMRRLVDRWSFSVMFMVVTLKFLQVLKKIGIKTKENGWRMLSGVFLRNEHSKFILASFRLNYHSSDELPDNLEIAKSILIRKLMDFLRSKPSCHWALEWGLFRAKRKKIFFTDIVEAKFSQDGQLLDIIPSFDNTRTTFTLLKEGIIQEALDRIVKVYNKNAQEHVKDHKRAWRIYKKLRRWIYRIRGLSFAGKSELCHLIERLLNATFIQFEVLTDDPAMLTQKRLATPNMKNRRHPGFGLLNIVCRFTADNNESDLWFQYHHVPVDGMPMQEMLRNLKQEWGEVGPVMYPALSSAAAQPEVFYFGNKLFRTRVYINFDKVLNVRKYLNTRYYVEMGGFASVASMIIWGLAQQNYFRDRKFLVPLDTELSSDHPQDRNISLIFIRPGQFFIMEDQLQGFFNYQREYNRRLFATRYGKSESYELLELYAMIHPLICRGARYVMPKAMGEILGTAGLSILKDAEMFISPLTDLQFNGFSALGNLRMPTEDGKTAGAVSICSTKKEVREYIKAIYHLADNYPDYLDVKL